MSEIISDIIDDVEIKPSKYKRYFKWIVTISVSLIGGAYILGQLNFNYINRINVIEQNIEKNENVHTEIKNELNVINSRIDKVYDDGYKAFDEYSQHNKKQLIMIIDYGNSNKELLRRMLDFNTLETNKMIENQLQQSKHDNNFVLK